MTEEQAKALKVGDKVIFKGYDTRYMSYGKEYEIDGFDSDGDPFVRDIDGDRYSIYGGSCEDFELLYRIEITSTEPSIYSGMTYVRAHVNDAMLDFMRRTEKDQARETKRQAIREQIAKLEAELEAL